MPATRYLLRLQESSTKLPIRTIEVSQKPKVKVRYAADYRLRAGVAGIDSLDRQGPWSEWSTWFPTTIDTIFVEDPGVKKRK